MNREEYMNELKSRLSSFDEEIRDEIINDYEEHFKMGAINGKSEEQIAAELGNIDELIEELSALSASEKNEEESESDDGIRFSYHFEYKDEDGKKTEKQGSFESFAESFARGLGSISASVWKNAGNFASGFASSATDFANSAANFASNFAKEVSAGFDEKMNGGKKEAEDVEAKEEEQENGTEDGIFRAFDDSETTQEDEETVAEAERSSVICDTDETCNVIVIEGGCADVTILPTDEDRVTIHYENEGTLKQKLAYRFYHRHEGNTIYCGVKRENTSSNFFNRVTSPDIEITVMVPDGLKEIIIRNLSGDISVNEVSVKTLKVETMSGDIELDDIDVKDITVHTVSGNVDINDASFIKGRVLSASGDISINETDCSGVSIDNVSGDIDYSGSAKKISVKTASGDANLTLSDTAEVNITSISGDVEIDMDDSGVGYTANIRTISGSVTLEYDSEERYDVMNGSYMMGNGEIPVSVSTVSGNISIEA